jgi:hypothetical protein
MGLIVRFDLPKVPIQIYIPHQTTEPAVNNTAPSPMFIFA